MSGALDDLRVLDLSTEVAGPFCARLLGDFGADVIKVEPPGGETGRNLEPLSDKVTGPERSAFFAYLNFNKRGIELNLETPRGRELLLDLVRQADVVVESFAPGYLEGFGLGFDALEAVKPGLVMTSITPYGQTGPWRDRPGNDLTAFAASGWAVANRTGNSPPLKSSGHQACFVAAENAFFGTISALYYRDRHGVGQQVDVSILETLTEYFSPRFLEVQHSDVVGRPRLDKPDFFSGPVPCQDGYFAMTISREHFWRDAMNVLGLPDLADAENYWSRLDHREELIARVDPAIAQWQKQDLFEALSLMRVVGGMVLNTEEVYANEHLRDREYFVEIDDPDLGKFEVPGAPFKMEATPWSMRRRSPRLGEHTDEVLRELLQLNDGAIAALHQEGVA